MTKPGSGPVSSGSKAQSELRIGESRQPGGRSQSRRPSTHSELFDRARDSSCRGQPRMVALVDFQALVLYRDEPISGPALVPERIEAVHRASLPGRRPSELLLARLGAGDPRAAERGLPRRAGEPGGAVADAIRPICPRSRSARPSTSRTPHMRRSTSCATERLRSDLARSRWRSSKTNSPCKEPGRHGPALGPGVSAATFGTSKAKSQPGRPHHASAPGALAARRRRTGRWGAHTQPASEAGMPGLGSAGGLRREAIGAAHHRPSAPRANDREPAQFKSLRAVRD